MSAKSQVEHMGNRQIALIRGINVGRAKRVAMADLRALVEGLGYREVKTLLNSGNIVFTALGNARRDAASKIEKAMATKLGVTARVAVITAAELASAIDENPLLTQASANPSRLLLTVLNDPADRKRLEVLSKEEWAPEAFALGKRVAYLWCPDGIITSRLMKAVERALGDHGTSRNWTTMVKLSSLASEP
jgi:uncharacterized protein (DUF1697 family)